MTSFPARMFRQCGASFLIGIVLSYYFSLSVVFFFAFLICVYLCYKRKEFIVLILILSSLLLGGYRYSSIFRELKNTAITEEAQIEINARIITEPILKESYQRIVIPKIVIYTDRYPRYNYGDIINIKGKVEPFADFRSYSSVIVSGRMSYPSIELLSPAKFSFRKASLLIKSKIVSSLQKIIPEPKSSLLISLMFGSKNNLGSVLEKQIRKCGLSHVIVASGLHLSIITKALSGFLDILCMSNSLNFVFSFLFILSFAFMAGLTPSIIRAAIMAFLLILSRFNFRLYNSFNALLLAAVIMIWLNPMILFWDLGFQLSFLATAGIIFLYPLWKENSFWQQDWFNQKGKIIRETLLSTFSALTFVIPWIIFKTDAFSLVSPITNLLILPFVPLIMMGGIIVGISSLLFYPLGLLFGALLNLILVYFLGVISLFSSLPWSQIYIPSILHWLIIPYYIFLFSYIYKKL
ncbi:MAG: ComEC/Rec2 family competence protein [Bacteroidales bacterium]|nr:ComEC/Rec2 family competence protein [Bacteroidales bacterium]